MPVPQNVMEFFDSAERALAAGDEAGAVGFLKKAKAGAPDDPEVKARIGALQRRMKAENLVRMGVRRLAAGSPQEAFASAREAFALMPQASGLEDLIAALEKSPSQGTASHARAQSAAQAAPTASRPALQDGADEYIRKVREQISLNALPNAAAIAAEGLERYPDSELLFTFVDKFRRMRLLK